MNKPYANLALLTDLDGTLLTPEKTISPQDAAAIADFRAKGGKLSFATGRGYQASEEIIALIKPDFPVVLYNGPITFDTAAGECTFKKNLPVGVGDYIRELMSAFPSVGAEVLDLSGVYVIQDGAYERRHLEITHIPIVFRNLSDMEPHTMLKALFAGAPEDISRMQEYIAGADFHGVSFTRSHTCFLEILPENTNKGTALEALRKQLPLGTVFGASGDFDNDIAMLKSADWCGCPKDAQPEVVQVIQEKGGFLSEKTSADGFFADWIFHFTSRYANQKL
ncbi:MAG: Cof-type HAD-IIB family hydrolase [Oscillospiraceae bacterium]|nr:Cof-type HAD-IIB family hydrolase [Oscillospiraceae bacterium]